MLNGMGIYGDTTYFYCQKGSKPSMLYFTNCKTFLVRNIE
jgi:hypothetical protein